MKWIALICMTLDHIALYFQGVLPGWVWFVCRSLGRLAFPLFAYALVLGYRRTRSLPRYFIRLAAAGVLTQLAMTTAARVVGVFVFVNVIYTLAIGLIALLAYDFLFKCISDTVARMRPAAPGVTGGRRPPDYGVRINVKGISLSARAGCIIGSLLALIVIFLVQLLKPDYNYYGIMTILLFHILEDQLGPYDAALAWPIRQHRLSVYFKTFFLLNTVWFCVNVIFFQNSLPFQLMKLLSAFAVFLFPFMQSAPDGRRPGGFAKYFFYIYYPAHLCLIMWLVRLLT